MELGKINPAEIIGRATQVPGLIGKGVLGIVKNFSCDHEGFAQQAQEANTEKVRVNEQISHLETRSMANTMATEVLRRASSGEPIEEPLNSLHRILSDPRTDITLSNIWLPEGHADMLIPLLGNRVEVPK